MTKAILVVDMLCGFLESGSALYCGSRTRDIIPGIQRLLEQELQKGSKIFFIGDQHDPDDPEFNIFPSHGVKGTSQAEIIPELSKYQGEYIPKNISVHFMEHLWRKN